MKKTIDSELKKELDRQHDHDWEYGPGWGAATCMTYRTRRYFTQEASEYIIDQAAKLLANWEKKLSKIPASQRYDGWRLVPELDKGEMFKFDNGDNVETQIPLFCLSKENTPTTTYAKIGIHVQCLYTSCRQYKGKDIVKVCSNRPECLNLKLAAMPREAMPSYGWVAWPDEKFGHMERSLEWDKELSRFYVVYTVATGTGPIPQEKRKKNWARRAKEKEFLSKIKDLQKNLLEAGVEIVGFDKNCVGDNRSVRCLYPREIPLSLAVDGTMI